MTSIRHKPDADEAVLSAARASILAVGWRRTTVTDVARRAGVSRMTVYRRWPDMQTLLADLLVREWAETVDLRLMAATPTPATIARQVVLTVRALRDNALLQKIVEVDPELLLPYLLHRRGRNQDRALTLLRAAIEAGQQSGAVRPGDPAVLAQALLLSLQGFVISTGTAADVSPESFDDEVAVLVERFLVP